MIFHYHFVLPLCFRRKLASPHLINDLSSGLLCLFDNFMSLPDLLSQLIILNPVAFDQPLVLLYLGEVESLVGVSPGEAFEKVLEVCRTRKGFEYRPVGLAVGGA
jgi:hypothetical protein